MSVESIQELPEIIELPKYLLKGFAEVLYGAQPAWHKEAACLDVADPDIFFHDRVKSDSLLNHAAKALCAGCTVQAECKASRPAHDTFSIRGGETLQDAKLNKADATSQQIATAIEAIVVETDGSQSASRSDLLVLLKAVESDGA